MSDQKNDQTHDLQIQDLVAYRINALANAILRSASRHFKSETGLHPPEIWVLCSVGIHEPITAREVAGRIAIDEAQVSRAIKALIEQKLVTRQPSEQDNRKKILRLSKKGRAIYREATRIAQGRQTNLLKGLSKQEIEAFQATLEVVTLNAMDLLGEN